MQCVCVCVGVCVGVSVCVGVRVCVSLKYFLATFVPVKFKFKVEGGHADDPPIVSMGDCV